MIDTATVTTDAAKSETKQIGGGLSEADALALKEHIAQYAILRKEANMLEYVLWSERTWKIQDGNLVFEVYDDVQKQQLEEARQGMAEYLRLKLNKNFLIQTKIVEMPAELKGNKLYTAKDKLEYLISQNPEIAELKRRLGFELDF